MRSSKALLQTSRFRPAGAVLSSPSVFDGATTTLSSCAFPCATTSCASACRWPCSGDCHRFCPSNAASASSYSPRMRCASARACQQQSRQQKRSASVMRRASKGPTRASASRSPQRPGARRHENQRCVGGGATASKRPRRWASPLAPRALPASPRYARSQRLSLAVRGVRGGLRTSH